MARADTHTLYVSTPVGASPVGARTLLGQLVVPTRGGTAVGDTAILFTDAAAGAAIATTSNVSCASGGAITIRCGAQTYVFDVAANQLTLAGSGSTVVINPTVGLTIAGIPWAPPNAGTIVSGSFNFDGAVAPPIAVTYRAVVSSGIVVLRTFGFTGNATGGAIGASAGQLPASILPSTGSAFVMFVTTSNLGAINIGELVVIDTGAMNWFTSPAGAAFAAGACASNGSWTLTYQTNP